MSEVKRLDFFAYLDDGIAQLDYHESDDGRYVLHEDYVALAADSDRLRDECEYLANENIELKLLIKNLHQQLSVSTKWEQKD